MKNAGIFAFPAMAVALGALFLAISSLLQVVLANTEIVNFAAFYELDDVNLKGLSRYVPDCSLKLLRRNQRSPNVQSSSALPLRPVSDLHGWFALSAEVQLSLVPAASSITPNLNCDAQAFAVRDLKAVEERSAEFSDDAEQEDCLHDVWLYLDLDDERWKNYQMFTVRVSWPAFVSA